MIYRRLPLSQTSNARDLGGYATPNGTTKWNVFFRSALPSGFSEKDRMVLAQCNVTTVVDLRGGDGNFFAPRGFEGLKRVLVALGDAGVPPLAEMVPQGYVDMLESSPQAVKTVFDLFAEEQGAVLFHCFAGKDRTGIVAALLLMLVGVDDQDIVADYVLTYPYLLDLLRLDFSRTDAEKYVFVPIPEHMQGFLKLFRQKYGSVQNYLLGVGVTQAQQQKILDKFIETK